MACKKRSSDVWVLDGKRESVTNLESDVLTFTNDSTKFDDGLKAANLSLHDGVEVLETH